MRFVKSSRSQCKTIFFQILVWTYAKTSHILGLCGSPSCPNAGSKCGAQPGTCGLRSSNCSIASRGDATTRLETTVTGAPPFSSTASLVPFTSHRCYFHQSNLKVFTNSGAWVFATSWNLFELTSFCETPLFFLSIVWGVMMLFVYRIASRSATDELEVRRTVQRLPL